jgi:hypothetical protein
MRIFLTCILLLSAGPLLAQGDTYRVDLLLFLDKTASSEAGRRFEPPSFGKPIAPDDAAALANAGITLLPEEQFALNDHWQRLKNSRRYQPLLRMAWTQQSPPADGRHALRVMSGNTMVVDGIDGTSSGLAKPLDGSVALMLGNYLNLDVNLAYTEFLGSGAQTWRLREKRRMKRDELHYLDGPRLAALARVVRVSGPSS